MVIIKTILRAAVANVDNVNNKHNEVVYLNQSGNRIYDAKYSQQFKMVLLYLMR